MVLLSGIWKKRHKVKLKYGMIMVILLLDQEEQGGTVIMVIIFGKVLKLKNILNI